MRRIREDLHVRDARRPRVYGTRSRLARALAWLAVAGAAAACALGPSNLIVEGQQGAPGVRRILLFPPNLVLALRAEIQSGAGPVDQEVETYLVSQGREVSRVDLLEGRILWKQSLTEAKAGGEIKNAPRIFVLHLAEKREFDAVVIPSLILHQTHAESNEASWDGVNRTMKMVNLPSRGASSRDDSTFAKGATFGGISGDVWVTSLHVLVFARDGRRIFEGRGGIDFLHEIEFVGRASKVGYEFRPNDSMFRNPETLHEGVVLAFTPYLTPPDE